VVLPPHNGVVPAEPPPEQRYSVTLESLRPWDPERIGPYAMLGRLGAGAMGQVYLGRSTSGRLVAVKTIRPELAEEAGFRTRFAQEVAAARRVSGVYTAAVVEADADADVPWLATAYIAAPSLRRLVKTRGVLPPATVRWLAAGCAEALQSIHAVGLVHMDLKPSNVLVAADGPRVIDFGVARAAARLSGGSGGGGSQGSPGGTPAYMSPEQARDLDQASAASDVFSLGGTLLFAATGHAPYHGETTADVLVQLATEPPDLSGLPVELDALVRACLERVPVRRPSSAALLARLGEFAEPGSYLPEAALAMIRRYERDPVSLLRAKPLTKAPSLSDDEIDDADERTADSYPGLPASARPDIPGPSLRSWRYRFPAWAGWAAAGAALVTLGALLGATLSDSDGSANNSPSNSALSNGRPPPASLGPVCASSAQPGTTPTLCVNIDEGTQATTFTVQAHGFTPGRDLTLTLLFYPPPQGALPPAPQRLRTITIPANGKFQLKPAQLGLYDVVAPGGTGAVFRIDPLGGGPP
jgi:serine/threonine protein kinase